MPTSIEELERKLDAIVVENATLRRRITDLEESVDSHVGIDYGAAQQLAPHPSMQITTAEFGGGKLRLDQIGVQVLADDSSGVGAVYFVNPIILTKPTSTTDVAALIGYVNSPEYYVALQAGDAGFTNPTRGAQVIVLEQSGLNEATLRAHYTATTYGRVTSYADSSEFSSVEATAARTGSAFSAKIGVENYDGVDHAFVVGPFSLGSVVADYALLGDGDIWYRSDTDRLRAQANGIVRNLTMDGTGTTLTIATGAVTITTSFHAIDTEAAGATDDLDTINGGQTGQVLYIHAANGARDVVAKDGTGNLKLAGDFTLNNTEDALTLIYDGSNWLELSRSDNGA